MMLLRWIPKVDVPESLPRIAVSEPSPDLLYAFPLLSTHKRFGVLRVE